MRYLLDTANLDAIRKYIEYFPVVGVTSNPTIVKREGRIDFFAHMRNIRRVIGEERSLHIQVTAADEKGMLRDVDRILTEVDEDVYIKVPVTMEGMKVIRQLKADKINVTATAIYTKAQGFLAIAAGADYIAPYYNRMENMGIDSEDVIASFAEMIANDGAATQILAASFKNAGQVDKAFLAGAHTATVSPDVLENALQMPAILKTVDDFSEDWKTIYGNVMIADL